MRRAYICRIYPSPSQAVLLDKHFGCCRWVYNEMIRINQKRYHRTGKGMSSYEMSGLLPKLKKQYPWLAEVNSQSLQIVCHNLADAYGKFLRRQSGYPSFKKLGHRSSFTAITGTRLSLRQIRLQKIGTLRHHGGDMPNGYIKGVTVSKVAGKFYASVLFDDGLDAPKPSQFTTVTGFDMGLIDLVVTSDGQHFPAPKHRKRQQARLRAAQKALSRKQKCSNRRKKAKLTLARIHHKIANQRKDSNHRITRLLVSDVENQAFAVESLAVRNMLKNHKLAGAIADAGWGQFLTFLRYKATAAGKPVIEVDRWYPSTKACSACGVVNHSLTLKHRVWKCECGAEHHRDINAARNIALEAARNVARGDSVRPRFAPAAVCEAQMVAAG